MPERGEKIISKFVPGITFWDPNVNGERTLPGGDVIQNSVTVVSKTQVGPGDERPAYIIETQDNSYQADGTKTEALTQRELVNLVNGWETLPGKFVGKTISRQSDPETHTRDVIVSRWYYHNPGRY